MILLEAFPHLFAALKKLRLPKSNAWLIGGAVVVAIPYGYIMYLAYQQKTEMFSVMLIALILGVGYENIRLKSSWRAMAFKILAAMLVALTAFWPRNNPLLDHLSMQLSRWPYHFVFPFVVFSVAYHDKKVIPKLTEGITLLQSISLVYWVLDQGYLSGTEILNYIGLGIGGFFVLLSLVHAFTYLDLSKRVRLWLSLWSSVIMIIFASDHIYRVFNYPNIVEDPTWNLGLNILQYFLLGMALMYIFQNAVMLFTYMPSKHRFYDDTHMEEIRAMNKTHIGRYAPEQIKIRDAALALVFTSGVYWVNYRFNLLPRHTMIWVVFGALPLLINLVNWWRQKQLKTDESKVTPTTQRLTNPTND